MVQWNDEANSKLLKAIIRKAKLTGRDYEYLAEVIGDGCTVKAVRNHVSRLVNGKDGSGATPESSPAKPKTPNGKGRGAGKSPVETTKSPASKKRKQSDTVYKSNASGDDAVTTPKKVKSENGNAVKVENSDHLVV